MNKKAIIGILFILVGTVFLLDNLGYDLDIPYYLFSWPAVFVVIGLINLLSGNARASFIFFALAAIFYLQYYDVIDLRDMWPIILIIIGLSFIFRKRFTPKSSDSSDDQIDEVAIFGGTEKKFVSENFQGGKITCMFGGSEIDLHGSKLAEGASIDVFCMFGGVEIIVPEDWKVDMDATAIFGGFSDSRKNVTDQPIATMRIKGFTMFGGGEIRT